MFKSQVHTDTLIPVQYVGFFPPTPVLDFHFPSLLVGDLTPNSIHISMSDHLCNVCSVVSELLYPYHDQQQTY